MAKPTGRGPEAPPAGRRLRQRTLRLELPWPNEDSLVLDTRSTPGLIVSQASQRENGHIVLVLEELTLDAVEQTEGMPGFVGEVPHPMDEPRELPVLRDDPWEHRSEGMRCSTCMWYVPKVGDLYAVLQDGVRMPLLPSPHHVAQESADAMRKAYVAKTFEVVPTKGRCRRHAPTMGGYPVVFPDDWCGDHKLA